MTSSLVSCSARHRCGNCAGGYRPDFDYCQHAGEDTKASLACEAGAKACPRHQCYYIISATQRRQNWLTVVYAPLTDDVVSDTKAHVDVYQDIMTRIVAEGPLYGSSDMWKSALAFHAKTDQFGVIWQVTQGSVYLSNAI